jgi:hypothetical protein
MQKSHQHHCQTMLLMAFNMQLPACRANSSAATKLCQLLKQAQAVVWKQWVAKQLDSDLAGRLFLAAAARSDLGAFKLLDSFKPGIVPAVLPAAMEEAVQQQNTHVLEYLCQLSCTKACDIGQLAAVLLAAVRAGYHEGVLAMLQVTTRYYEFGHVLGLPVARALPWEAFEVLFNAAVKQQDRRLFSLLQSMPAQAAQMACSHVTAAVGVAARLQDERLVQQYLAHPAVCNAEPDQLRQLLVAVLQLRGTHPQMRKPLEALCSMQNFQRLSSWMIEDVLNTAFSTSGIVVLELQWLVLLLCQLPQAPSMQLGSVLGWLQLALAQTLQQATVALCGWLEQHVEQRGNGVVVSGFGSREAAGLLQSALQPCKTGSRWSLESVCSLECVKRAADASTLVLVLESTLAFEATYVRYFPAATARLLLQLPAAADIPAPDLARFTASLLQHCSQQVPAAQLRSNANPAVLKPELLKALCSMPGMQHLSSPMIQNVMQTAIDAHNRGWSALEWLVPLMCQLPQAQCVQLSSVLGWLQLALAQTLQQATAALCSWLERNAAQPRDAAAGAGFGNREAEGLLVSALPTGKSGSLASLKAVCSLECVRRMTDASAVVRVFNSTMALSHKELRY